MEVNLFSFGGLPLVPGKFPSSGFPLSITSLTNNAPTDQRQGTNITIADLAPFSQFYSL